MKTKLRRLSKRTLALILCSLMLLSALGIGTWITANAASSTYTVYFRNNANWSNVYVLTGSNLNMDGSSGAYKNLYGSNINNFKAMSLVPGETNVYKASVTVYDNKIAFASANSTQSGYYASSGSICCVGNMSSGKVCNMWTDAWTSQNGAAYKKYNLEDYTPPAINITGINGDWTTGDGLTLDSGNNYYYSFTGDGYDKYFRFKIGSTYYEAYDNNFDLENGSGGPYDGTTDAKKYGARSGNGNAFKLTASTSYNYKIYFDISGKKVWFTKTARTTSVTLDKQSGTGGTSSVTATYGAAMPSATMPTRTGYTFNGYFTSTGGSGTKYYNANGTSAKNWDLTDSSKTLYAYWTAKSYSITYKDQGNVAFSGTHASGYPTTHTYGTATTLKSASKDGYTFGGWFTSSDCSGSAVTSLGATAYTANITLYAKWTANTYTITYKDQGGSAFSGTHASGAPTSHTYGTATSLKTASKDGYTFGGWFTTSACTGSAVTSLGATSYTANITLYAKWTIKTYTITYNKGANGTGTIASGTKTHGVDFTLSSSTFTRADYTQTGWSTTDGGAKAYELGGTYTANSNITLYPYWTLSASPQLASISNVTGKTVNDTSFNATTTINNSQYASGTLTVTASSNSTSIITVGTVNKSGNDVTIPLTVKGPGTATITVTLKDGSTTVDTKIFTVTVDAPTFTITADTVYASTKNKALTVTKSPTPSSTTWASNKTSYVTVNSSGQVTTVAIPTSDQTVTITATATYACGYSTSFTGTVTLKAPTLTITSNKTSGYINDTATASVSSAANPSLTTNTLSAYNWTSSDPSVVSVSSATAASPTLTFLKNGTATISLEVTYKNTLLKKTSNSVTITVNPPTVTMSGKNVAKGDSVTFSATTANPSSGLTITYSLQSAVSGVSITSAGVASVTSSCSASSATVVATVKNAAGDTVATKTATLTIQNPTLTIADIENNSTQYATIGTNIANKTLTTNFTNASFTPTSSKTSVATVSVTNGKLTVVPVAKGKTTITVEATKGSISVSQTFTVKVAAAASTDVVVYLQDFTYNNNDGWGAAYIHTWETDGGAAISDRAQMTKIGVNSSGRSVYAYKFTAAQWAKVNHIVFLKTNADSAWDDQWSHTEDKFNGTHGTTTAFQLRSDSNGSARKLDTSTISISIPQISADDIADLPITTSTTLYADVVNNTTPSKFTWSSASTSIATVANADTGTTDHNSITGVYPGTTTITIKAYAALPTGWTSIVTDGTADAFLADSTTASVTVTATPKTVSWGNKLSTDNGSTFATTNASAAGTVSVSPTMSNGGSVAHGTQITFTATTNSGYKFAGWQVDGNNNFTTTTSKTITVTANTTVYALYYKTWTITVNKNTGINTYKTNHSSYTGTYSAASKTFTVNAGQSFNIKNITYTAGYESDTSTNLTNSDVQNNITVTINAKKTNYSVSGSLSPSGLPSGITIKFKKSTASSYSNSLSNANVGDNINIQVTTTTGYYLKTLTASAGTAPSIPSSGGNGTSYTMNYTMTASDVTFTATLAQEISVNFNIDMHESAVNSTKVLQLFISSSANNPTATTDHTGASCSIISSGSSPTLTKQSTSTVYSGNVNVPITGDTVYFVVRYDGTNYYKSLSKTQISGGTVWLETTSDSPTDLSIVYSTNNTPTVASGYQRIYLKKPYGWQDTTEGQKWTNIGVYYWGDNPTDIGWANDNSGDYRVTKMKYLGYDTDTSSGFHYYYADIPTTITQNSTPYTVKNIIFQGWGSNESLGGDSNKIHAQTENVMNFTKNYFTLNNSNNVITAEPAATNAKVPTYTRYASSVTVQKGETQTINIKPTSSNTITYSSSNTSVATVSSSGVVTPVAKGTATITVKVYGTVGYLVRSNEQTDKDRKSYTLTVTVKDPSVTSGFDIMSLATRTSTITIPQVSSTQPGYFDSAPSVAVTGTPNAPTAGYTNSAIVTATATQSVSGVGSKATTYTVKYAAPNSTFTGYSGITVTAAEIVSKSIRFEGSERYGYDHWEKGGSTQSYTVTKSVTDGVETAITNNIALDGSTFSEVFSSYTYVDVTFNFDYYEYKTERTVQKLDAEGNPIPIYDSYDNPTGEYETEQKNFYYYDPTWVGTEDRTSGSFNASKHIPKTYTVTDFEVRNKTATAISASGYDKSNLVGDAGDAVYNMPTSNYYKYTLNASTIKTISKTNNYKATINVELKHNPKAYTVKLNGSAVNNSNSEYSSYHSADGTSNKYYYQEYAKLTNSTSLNWILTDSGQSYTGPTMYTGKSYKFRVTGDTYLKTSAGTVSDADFNRTRVALTGQEVKHEPKSATNSTIVEKLYNNFYIADFFDPAKVLNDRDLPEDDVKFVGGGVVYYQIKDGVPAQKAVDGGYVNSSTGLADADAIKEFIQEKIEANLTNTTIVPNDIEGDDDRMAIAYGYEHKAQKDADTDLFYRYLPYEVYNRTGGGTLETETVEGVTSYTLATERQSNAYRYSNALKAYQYIYASSMENKIANAGKNMCLYAYYIYSYTEYDNVTGIPRTVYKVVLSDQPANATSYFHNPNSNS